MIWSGAESDGIVEFMVYRHSDIDTPTTITIDSPDGSVNEYLDQDVLAGIRYTYSVSAKDGKGKEGLRSSEATFVYE